MQRKQNSSYKGGTMGEQINCTMMDKNIVFGGADHTDAEV